MTVQNNCDTLLSFLTVSNEMLYTHATIRQVTNLCIMCSQRRHDHLLSIMCASVVVDLFCIRFCVLTFAMLLSPTIDNTTQPTFKYFRFFAIAFRSHIYRWVQIIQMYCTCLRHHLVSHAMLLTRTIFAILWFLIRHWLRYANESMWCSVLLPVAFATVQPEPFHCARAPVMSSSAHIQCAA